MSSAATDSTDSAQATARKLVVGNWKLHGGLAFNADLLAGLLAGLPTGNRVAAAVCVPFPYLAQCKQLLEGSALAFGAQDVSAQQQGAYTGEVAAPMIAEFGARFVIVGHSERRMYHAETDAQVATKAARVLESGMTPIVCVGETLAQREAGETDAVVSRQLGAVLSALDTQQAARLVVAYEPVWAIGTGKTATREQAQAVHARLRAQLAAKAEAVAAVRILYGGSVKPDNASELFAMPDIDGGLIGGASLKAKDFLAICGAA